MPAMVLFRKLLLRKQHQHNLGSPDSHVQLPGSRFLRVLLAPRNRVDGFLASGTAEAVFAVGRIRAFVGAAGEGAGLLVAENGEARGC